MKKHMLMLLTATLITCNTNTTKNDFYSSFSFEDTIHTFNMWLIEELPIIFTQSDATSLTKCFGSALGTYFVGDFFTEMANDFDEAVEKKKSSLRLSKAFMHTWATLFRAIGYTGKGYAMIALASIPVRFLYPALQISHNNLYDNYLNATQ